MPIDDKAIARTLKKHRDDVRHPGAIREIVRDYQFFEGLPKSFLDKYEDIRRRLVKGAGAHPDAQYTCLQAFQLSPNRENRVMMAEYMAHLMADLLDEAATILKE